MATMTMTTEQHREALTTVVAPHPLQLRDYNRLRRYAPRDVSELAGEARALYQALLSVGIKPAASEHYEELTRIGYKAPSPDSLLALNVDQYAAHQREVHLYAATRAVAGDASHSVRKALDQELYASMRAEVEDYCDLLRPAFDHAAQQLRAAAEAGIKKTTTAEQAMILGEAARGHWLALAGHRSPVKMLTGVVGLRLQMSLGLDVLPGGSYNNGELVPFAQCFGGGPDLYNPDVVLTWRDWLGAARQLTLRSPAQIAGPSWSAVPA